MRRKLTHLTEDHSSELEILKRQINELKRSEDALNTKVYNMQLFIEYIAANLSLSIEYMELVANINRLQISSTSRQFLAALPSFQSFKEDKNDDLPF